MPPVASIIVLAYGNRRASERCLETLEVALGDELGNAYELVLVDNDSPDDTARLFAAWADRATVVSMPENRNFSGGCNAGARAATGDVLIFLNNDTEVPPGALQAVAEQAREPGVGAVGPRLLYADGTIQHAGVVHREWDEGVVLPLHLFHHEPGDLPAARASYDLDAVTGACLAMRAPLFHELGGFDEEYVNGLEDVDLCLRARTAGWRVVYRGDVQLVHHERVTRGAGHDERANAAIFHRRWRSALSDDDDTLGRLFDLGFGPMPPQVGRLETPEGAPLAVEGRLRSPSPDGFEARALLGALAQAGLDVAAREWFPVWEAPRDGGSQWTALGEALQRPAHPSAVGIRVHGGRAWSLPAGAAAVARIATMPAEGALLDVAAVWAASPRLAEELVTAGLSPGAVEWLPPAIPDGPPGPGGDGILALLPAHDLDLAAVLLEALAAFPDQRVRLLPNVSSPAVAALAAARCPGAELLRPTSDERVLRELAGSCDVVCGTDGDGFERRLLLAAAAGAAVVGSEGGVAGGVLGEDTTAPADVAPLRAAIERGLCNLSGRIASAELVRAACGRDAFADRLPQLVESAFAARRSQTARVALTAPL